MIMTTIQKIIRIGSSKGVTLPAKDLKRLGVDIGDEVELVVRHRKGDQTNTAVTVATDILDRYDDDFRNLASR